MARLEGVTAKVHTLRAEAKRPGAAATLAPRNAYGENGKTRFDAAPARGAKGVALRGDRVGLLPLRSGKVALRAIEAWDESSGIGKDQARKKQEHVAGKASQLVDAYPFLMMKVDLAPEGAYYAMSQLVKGVDSPEATLVGDPHSTNFGSVPSPDRKRVVYGVIDGTKAGRGRIEADLHRLATTTVIEAVRAKSTSAQAVALLPGLADAYFSELRQFVKSGKRPPAFIDEGELGAQSPVKGLLKKAGETDPNKAVKKYADGKRFTDDFHLHGKKERRRVADAFVAALPEKWKGRVDVLDVGSKVDVGGSNSGMTHYLLLARVKPPGEHKATVVFEVKQVIPAPSRSDSGSPQKASAKDTVNSSKTVSPFKDALAVPMTLRGLPYIVEPYDAQKKSVDPTSLHLPDQGRLANDNGRVLARVHAQTVDRASLAAWLQRVDDEATDRLSDFAQIYGTQQTAVDAQTVKAAVR